MHARIWDRYYLDKVLKTIFKLSRRYTLKWWGICDMDVLFIIYAIYSRCFERLQKRSPASLADKFIIILQKCAGCTLGNLNYLSEIRSPKINSFKDLR